jgi:hypothetical protein
MTGVPLQCGRCSFCYEASHDAIRIANDTDSRVPCPRCERRKAQKAAPKPRTKADAVLLAVMKLTNAEGEPVFRTPLVYAVWSAARESFGLEGDRTRFPDSKLVDTYVAHLLKKGWLKKAKPNHWTVTDAGYARVKAMR